MEKRNTRQRRMIDAALEKLCHPTAEDIWLQVCEDAPNVSKTTVYRNLRRMVEEGTLHRITTEEGVDRYDPILTKHYHVRCERCHRIRDLDMPILESPEAAITDRHGYDITGHDLTFSGICPDCRKH